MVQLWNSRMTRLTILYGIWPISGNLFDAESEINSEQLLRINVRLCVILDIFLADPGKCGEIQMQYPSGTHVNIVYKFQHNRRTYFNIYSLYKLGKLRNRPSIKAYNFSFIGNGPYHYKRYFEGRFCNHSSEFISESDSTLGLILYNGLERFTLKSSSLSSSLHTSHCKKLCLLQGEVCDLELNYELVSVNLSYHLYWINPKVVSDSRKKRSFERVIFIIGLVPT